MMTNVELDDQLPIVFIINSIMLINMDPGVFVIIATALFGPFLYACLYIISYIISLWSQQPPTNNFQLNELQPDTHVGCPNGLCYLPLFVQTYHPRIINRIGHFPSVLALTTIPTLYRTKVRGVFRIIGDGVAHFEPNNREEWA